MAVEFGKQVFNKDPALQESLAKGEDRMLSF